MNVIDEVEDLAGRAANDLAGRANVHATSRMDTEWLELMVESYPEDIREPVLWLGGYLRDACGRSMDVLSGRAQKLDVELDKTNWSKILRGRWNRDAEGKPLEAPIVSKAKLLRAIHALRQDARLRSTLGTVPFVVTSLARAQWDYMDTKRVQDRVNKLGVIVGHTGMSKSASFEEYKQRNAVGVVTHVESPENGSLPELISHIAKHHGVGLTSNRQYKREKIFTVMNDRRCIIVDNAQDLYQPRWGYQQPSFGFLRRLQDETKCTIILSMTPWGEKTLFEQFLKGYMEQFEGRAGGRRNFLRLPEYPPEEDVLLIAQSFALREAERHLEYLVKISKERGRIRSLFEALQSAKVLAERKKTALTIGHVKACREED